MSHTPSQRRAIEEMGNVLVAAGAGAGKTRTVTERCMHHIFVAQPAASIEELLVVTFTEAAAAELRDRIRLRIERQLAENPHDERYAQQLALMDTASIGTLHGFCYKLVREHFFDLELDPQLIVLPQEDVSQLTEEVLDRLFSERFSGQALEDEAFRAMIRVQAKGVEEEARRMVRRIHNYGQTLVDPAGWIAAQLADAGARDPAHWRAWWYEGVGAWRNRWLPVMAAQPPEHPHARRFLALLNELSPQASAKQIGACLGIIADADLKWPRGTNGVFRKPHTEFFEDAKFLASLAEMPGGSDALQADWDRVRGHHATLLGLARDFEAEFRRAKRERGGVDFHDLEQMALSLLWDREHHCARPLAEAWRRKFKLVLVDEYQDINAAQDAILTALSGVEANRFLVGDVKQSIYRFRLANPRIFQGYAKAWGADPSEGKVIFLSENFRSHEGILDVVNAFFESHMRPELGGVAYDESARLRFGNRAGREHHSLSADPAPRVEVRLLAGAPGDATQPDDGELEAAASEAIDVERSKVEREAGSIARRLAELREERRLVWDEAESRHRPVEWRDMVILLRSVASRVEAFAREFSRLGIPLQAPRAGFFESIEIRDLVSLLQVLDNASQDVPLLAVLRSPFVGVTPGELARIRIFRRYGPFWTALVQWHDAHRPETRRPGIDASEAADCDIVWKKVHGFLNDFKKWRSLARQLPLSQRLETILDETFYLDWLATQPRARQRRANVQKFLGLARKFDQLQQQGLNRFIESLSASDDGESNREPDIAAGDAVQLMTIHGSKGLEFPVVVVADLDARFNFGDAEGSMSLDEEYGLCCDVKVQDRPQFYPSLPSWLAKRRRREESLGEQMRLLYVAMTRARDWLILSGTLGKHSADRWAEGGLTPPSVRELQQARCYLDWLGPWLTLHIGDPSWANKAAGTAAGVSWSCGPHGSERAKPLFIGGSSTTPIEPLSMEGLGPDERARLEALLTWEYPHGLATLQAAKSTVTLLRRQIRDARDADADSLGEFASWARSPWPGLETVSTVRGEAKAGHRLSSAEVGSVHHVFMQRVDFNQCDSLADLRREAERLRVAGALSGPEVSVLDLNSIAGFWASSLGKQILTHRSLVHREVPFTVRVTGPELAAMGLREVSAQVPEGEFIVVQGVADLVVLLSDEIWLVDFKTDRVSEAQILEKVRLYEPQMRLYAHALAKIYHRKVALSALHFLSIGKTHYFLDAP